MDVQDRKVAERITKKTLEDFLSLIGWSVRFHGADHYRIYNQYGKVTLFAFIAKNDDEELYDIFIDEYDRYKAFGGGNKYGSNGHLSFILKGCTLDALYTSGKCDCVSIITGNEKVNQSAFLSFYNHDK